MKYKPAVTPYMHEIIITKDNRRQHKLGEFPSKKSAQEKCNELNQEIKLIVTNVSKLEVK